MRKFCLILSLLLGGVGTSFIYAQVSYTANDSVPSQWFSFGYGSNTGYYPPHNNVGLADLAAGDSSRNMPGAGVRSFRSALPDEHLTNWGTNVELSNWRHYDSRDIKSNVAFVGYPHPSKRDTRIICPSRNAQSGMFQGLYLPIWDNGQNGTPVNDQNLYARYLWDVVNTYKNYVRYWEIWNEPDFENGQVGWRPPNDPQGWWNRDDFECDLVGFNGTIFEYIRMLRISWEVIKTIDPSAFVTTGGIGYESFLDAILRNTDNPNGGAVTAQYPLKGGAYFDVLSYHVYPQFEPEVRFFSVSQGGWVDKRNSDAAADAIIGKKNRFNTVLETHGYDGVTYPGKRWINTEHNIGRRGLGGYVGGEVAQRNYQIKANVLQQMHGVEQSYVFALAESGEPTTATSTYDLMGFFPALTNKPLNRSATQSGIANRTCEMLLHGTQVDLIRTSALQLPAGVRGAAFVDRRGAYTYVLWAEVTGDNSELAQATYSFPPGMVSGNVRRYEWDYGSTRQHQSGSPQNITLMGAPSFFVTSTSLPVEWSAFEARLTDDMTVALHWETRRELNNLGFAVERSVDGAIFEQLVQLAPEGSDGRGGSYVYRDTRPVPGANFYRIRQYDLDGRYSYSAVVRVWVWDAGNVSWEVSPTLLSNARVLHINWSNTPPAEPIELFDLAGRMVARRQHDETQTLTWELPRLSPGYYFLKMGAQLRRRIWVN